MLSFLISLAYCSLISKTMYLQSLSTTDKLIYSDRMPVVQINRQYQKSTIVTTTNTTSFKLNLVCDIPYGESSNSSSNTCNLVESAFIEALIELERYIVLPKQVIISATFSSFCISSDAGQLCNSTDKVLGFGAPANQISISAAGANLTGLDPNYGYPSSLIRQYASVAEMVNITNDINVQFNSDYNWLLNYTEPIKWGSSLFIAGGFYRQVDYFSYDFRETATHEILHGLGFLSGWSEYASNLLPGVFFPAGFLFDSNGNVLGVGQQWIFDRFISDSVNSVWLASYANQIRKSVVESVNATGNWYDNYLSTTGYIIGKSLVAPKKGLFVTQNALNIWYLSKGSTPVFKAAIISSPSPYAAGSSLSHVDSVAYNSIDSFLMRTSATSNVLYGKTNPGSRNKGVMGETILGILRSMGYVVRQ